jgi:hypothetical protein
MAAFWAPIEAAISAWLAGGAGLEVSHVLWANQRVAIPVRPYATLKRGSLRRQGGPGGELGHTTDADATATVAVWRPSTAYLVGASVINGANVYLCITAGTSGASSPTYAGPTGTGDHVADGTCFWAWSRPTAAGTRFTVTHRHEFTVSVQVFASATVGDAQGTLTSTWERTAADYMADASVSLDKPSVLDAFASAGIAAVDVGPIRDLGDDKAGTWMSRAQMDVTFACVKSLTDFATTIDQVTGSIEVADPDGTVDPTAFDFHPTA